MSGRRQFAPPPAAHMFGQWRAYRSYVPPARNDLPQLGFSVQSVSESGLYYGDFESFSEEVEVVLDEHDIVVPLFHDSLDIEFLVFAMDIPSDAPEIHRRALVIEHTADGTIVKDEKLTATLSIKAIQLDYGCKVEGERFNREERQLTTATSSKHDDRCRYPSF